MFPPSVGVALDLFDIRFCLVEILDRLDREADLVGLARQALQDVSLDQPLDDRTRRVGWIEARYPRQFVNGHGAGVRIGDPPATIRSACWKRLRVIRSLGIASPRRRAGGPTNAPGWPPSSTSGGEGPLAAEVEEHPERERMAEFRPHFLGEGEQLLRGRAARSQAASSSPSAESVREPDAGDRIAPLDPHSVRQS